MLSRRILVRAFASPSEGQRLTPVRTITTYENLHLKETAAIVQNMPTPAKRRTIAERSRLDEQRRVLRQCVEQLNTGPFDSLTLTFRHHSKTALEFVAEQVRSKGYVVDNVNYGLKDRSLGLPINYRISGVSQVSNPRPGDIPAENFDSGRSPSADAIRESVTNQEAASRSPVPSH